MALNRFVPVVLALALGGCGSIGLPPLGGNQPPPQQVAGGLPPPQPVGQTPTTGAVVSEPLPTPGEATQPGTAVAAASQPAQPQAGGSSLGRTDLLGGWTIASSGDSCQLFMTLTSWTGGYRASTRGCSSTALQSISAWNLNGRQVVLSGQGGTPVATLNSSGNNRFDGQTGQGAPVSFYR